MVPVGFLLFALVVGFVIGVLVMAVEADRAVSRAFDEFERRRFR